MRTRLVVVHAAVVVVLGAFAIQQAGVGRSYRASAAVAVALGYLIASALVAWPRARRLVPVVVPILVAAGFGLAFATTSAAVAASFGLVAAILLAIGVDVGRLVDRGVHQVGAAITTVLGVVAFVLLVVPAWAWTRLRRSDVLRGPGAGPTWSRPADHDAPAALGSELPDTAGRRSSTSRLVWGIGCVAMVLALNFALGWAWDARYPTDPPAPARSAPDDTATGVEGPTPRDPRTDSPAMADAPWREQYFDDLQRPTVNYWPFTESRPNDFRSVYLNIEGWTRRTYQPQLARTSMPTVWMFGGSTMWGEGQRDEYTIASWVARLAEEAGLPIAATNYGQRGWTHFQEMVLYEQRLAAEPDPDLAIFYDGANEVTTQSLLNEAVPTHTLAYAFAQRLLGSSIATQFLPPQSGEDDGDPDSLWDAYEAHSALHKVVEHFRPRPAYGATGRTEGTGVPADEDGPPSLGDEFTEPPQQDGKGATQLYIPTPEDGTDAGRVYERVKLLTLELSRVHDVETVLVWQPVGWDNESYRQAVAELTDSTIDLSHVLDDHDEVYLDGAHTNEEGARLVAAAIWDRLEPRVRAWYERHG